MTYILRSAICALHFVLCDLFAIDCHTCPIGGLNDNLRALLNFENGNANGGWPAKHANHTKTGQLTFRVFGVLSGLPQTFGLREFGFLSDLGFRTSFFALNYLFQVGKFLPDFFARILA